MVGFATETGYLSGTGEKKPRIQTQAFITTGYGFWKLDTDIDPTFSLYNNRMIRSIRNTGPNLEGGYIFQQSKCCLHFKLCFFLQLYASFFLFCIIWYYQLFLSNSLDSLSSKKRCFSPVHSDKGKEDRKFEILPFWPKYIIQKLNG